MASALTAVTVAPTHRRRGLLTEMITGDLRESTDRGEVVSILLASEYPIYGRFGYGAATELATYAIETEALGFVAPSEGAVELVELATLRARAGRLRGLPPRPARLHRSQRRLVGPRAPAGPGAGRGATQGVPGRLPVAAG